MATLHLLQTDLSVADVHLMLEVLAVRAHNRRIADEFHRAHPELR